MTRLIAFAKKQKSKSRKPLIERNDFRNFANQERSAPAEPKIRAAQVRDLSAQFFML